MDNSSLNTELMRFIASSPTPFHAVKNMAAELGLSGYVRLDEKDRWDIGPGRYYTTRNDSSIVAFNLPEESLCVSGISIVGAHTDSPCLKAKPNPIISKQGYIQLGVEVYGGVLLNPWYDRDLSLAGRVTYRNDEGSLQSLLIDYQEPLAVIPSLAIHLDREVNQQRSINQQTDIVPIMLQSNDPPMDNFQSFVAAHIANEHGIYDIDRVLDYELYFYDTQAPSLTGLNKDFISAARLDNLLSCFVGMKSLLEADETKACLLVCNDHEEVGSASACGAQGPFLKSVLDRLFAGPGELARIIDQSIMISCDNAHGIHPNYSDRHDGNHGPILNKGPVIKRNANQRYATNSETSAYFRNLCLQADVPVQDFVTRTDMGCGSTIGPITAAEIGVKTVDVGVPQFAMHSIRETCGSRDPYYLYQVLCSFFQDQNINPNG